MDILVPSNQGSSHSSKVHLETTTHTTLSKNWLTEELTTTEKGRRDQKERVPQIDKKKKEFSNERT
jgi:hypothetical protein